MIQQTLPLPIQNDHMVLDGVCTTCPGRAPPLLPTQPGEPNSGHLWGAPAASHKKRGVPTEQEHPGATFQTYIHLHQKNPKKRKTVLSISFSMPLIKVVTNNLGYLGFSIEYSPREKVPLEIDIKRPVYMSFTYAARYRYSLACKLQLACLSNGSWTKLCGLGVCWLVVGWGALCDSSIQATSK